LLIYVVDTEDGAAKLDVPPLTPSLIKVFEVLKVPSTPINGTDVDAFTAVSTTPKAFELDCLIISPFARVTLPGIVNTTLVTAVNIADDVSIGELGELVDCIKPLSSNHTAPPELKSPD
jgi:hypothetical protein